MNGKQQTTALIASLMLLTLTTAPVTAQFQQQGGKLTGSDAVGVAGQGTSVSLSADGNTALVGGYLDNSGVGAAWVYTRSGGVWSQQGQKLVGSDPDIPAWRGVAARISGDGNTAVIAGHSPAFETGSAWIFVNNGGTWTQQGDRLVPNDAAGISWFGQFAGISYDGNTVAIGGYADDNFKGATWVFTRSGTTWTQQGPKLVGTGASGSSGQGMCVAMSGDGNTILTGGSFDNGGSILDHGIGAVWVFTRSGSVWTQQGGKLVGSGYVGTNPRQGISVSLSSDGNTAMVGGYTDADQDGAAWIFTRSGGVWSQQGPKLVGTGATNGARQGGGVALSGDGNRALIGAPHDENLTGATWVFERQAGVWSQAGTKRVGSGTIGQTMQGAYLCLSADGETFIAGGWRDNDQVGAAWVFVRDTTMPLTDYGITSVVDVPADQGGKVLLYWNANHLDTSLAVIPYYSIWRAVEEFSPAAASASPYVETVSMDFQGMARRMSVINGTTYSWEWIANQPAHRFAAYAYAAPTLFDQMPGVPAKHYFLVSAHTTDPDVFYDSNVDSGYSVDNLAPIPPAGLTATTLAGPQVELTWDAPIDSDVGEFLVYRSLVSGFTPAPGDLIGSSGTLTYLDLTPTVGQPNYYRVVAVDIHDNPSQPSGEAPALPGATYQFNVNNRWNIVSVPALMSDYSRTALFPSATSQAFAFEDGYAAHGILANGRGYWVTFSGGQLVSHPGSARTVDTIDVVAGWNMIGTLSVPVAAATVGSIPGGIVTSQFFGYATGYAASSTLEPGRGYWVKATSDGQLILSGAGIAPSAGRIRIEPTSEMPPAPPGDVVGEVPAEYSLSQNYPNPFNPTTSIRFDMPEAGYVSLVVYNLFGEEVARLVDAPRAAGTHEVRWNGTNAAGDAVGSGVYFYKLVSGAHQQTRKMLLLK